MGVEYHKKLKCRNVMRLNFVCIFEHLLESVLSCQIDIFGII